LPWRISHLAGCGFGADFLVHCPICKRKIDPSRENRFRPFCSERCRMVDLGGWVSESYRLPAEDSDDGQTPLPESGRSEESAPAGRDKKILH
jgi:endogenous inhibitor of DNA gyrase (YacG/DUF329 family)